jgi:AcrR family transcriptional regulator
MVTANEKSSRRSPTQRRSKDTVEAILQATARILVRDGPDAATTNRIAKEAGVSIGSLYQYFGSREAIVTALAQAHAEEMLALLASHVLTIAAAPPDEAVRTFVAAMIAAHRTAPELHVVLLQQTLADGPAALKAIHDPARGMVRAWLEQHRHEVRPKDLDTAAFLLTTTAEAAIHAQIVDDPTRLRDPAWEQELVDLLLRYLLD